jgi:hypothetical protein
MINKEKLLIVALGLVILISSMTLITVSKKSAPQPLGVGWTTQTGMEIINEIASTTHAIIQTITATNITATGTATLATLSASGSLTASSGATFTGNVVNSNGFYGLFYASSTFVTPTTATNTLCAIQNTTGQALRIADVAPIFASTTAAKVGSFVINVGTSSNAYVTSTSPFIKTMVTTQNGKAIASTTSTLDVILGWPAGVATDTYMGAEFPLWQPLEWMVFKATTTTAPGRCTVLAF